MNTETPAVDADEGARSNRLLRWSRVRPWLIGAVAIGLSLALLHGLRSLLQEVRYEDILAGITATSAQDLTWAFLATAASYFALVGYDLSALRFVDVKVRRSSVFLTSFIAYALGNTIGLGVLTGGAVRMRLYSAAGVEASKIGAVIAFNAGAFGLGMTVCGAVGLLWGANDVSRIAHMPGLALQAIAVLVLLGTAMFVMLCVRGRPIRLFDRWNLRLPPVKLVLWQLLISIADLVFAATVLWVLLPKGIVPLPTFAAFYVIGIALGVLSHLPGGLGVFEAVILLACAGRAPADQVASALVLYRAIYFIAPLFVAATLLAVYELRSGAAAPIGRAAVRLSPILLAALTFIGGALLLISGVTPATDEASDLLALKVPLPLVEAAHFIGSVAGVAMLFVARGLLVRLDAAWWAALILSVVAAVLAIPKGIAISEASLLGLLAMLLAISRKQFDRRSALFALTLERGWWLSIALVVASCVWLLFFVYQDVPYADQMWWQFEFNAHAPRSLRALVGVVLTVLAVATWQLLREPKGRVVLPSQQDLDRVMAIVAQQNSADGCLAMTADKSFLFSESGKSFIMYGKRGRSWIALFDPVGPRSEWPDLIWRFIEMSHVHGGRAAFYQVRPDSLSLYLDAGLRAYKLGEQAAIALKDFSLKGSRRANLRYGVNRAEREGLKFEIVPREQVSGMLAELRAVSDAWLHAQNAREKGFSLGTFDARYLELNAIALVRQVDRIVAFASLMSTETKQEATVDLMRHLPGAPMGTMDFLFAKVILHFQSLGFERFNLGMAPMSGMASHELAPRWHRFGRFAFERGGRFYNFRGLRSFKEKFDPQWEARYLAAPGGIAPFFVLADVAALINTGARGVKDK